MVLLHGTRLAYGLVNLMVSFIFYSIVESFGNIALFFDKIKKIRYVDFVRISEINHKNLDVSRWSVKNIKCF